MRNLLLQDVFRIFVFLSTVSVFACGHSSPFFNDKLPDRVAPPAEASQVESTVFLIGDAGEPSPDGNEPALRSLKRQIQLTPDSAYVFFLGDNIYPAGLPEVNDEKRAESERYLLGQIMAVDTGRAQGIFIPGNHDWDRYGRDGWEAIKRQEKFVEEKLGTRGRFLPDGGCPGPVTVDIGKNLRVIVLDTQWWLHEHDKPRHPNSSCSSDTTSEILADLQKAIASASHRAVLIAAHHPLETHGIHGGFYGWRDHLFPLLNFSKYLWVPLPGIGSIYPLVRSLGISDQDLAGSGNEKMRHALEKVFEAYPPLAYASGHEHSLQILKHSRLPSFLIISGHGSMSHTEPVSHDKNTLFAHQHTGFVKLDVLDSGQVRLAVIEPQENGEKDIEVFSTWLRESARVESPFPPSSMGAGIGLPADDDAIAGDQFFSPHAGPSMPRSSDGSTAGRELAEPEAFQSTQDDSTASMDSMKTTTVVPGARYEAGGLHKFFFGAHHRDLWTKPVKVPVLDLATFRGGVTPIKRGGGFQTKSLRFRDSTGMQWQFRSIDKDPSKALPGELRETVAKNIIQDQISSSHPYSALVVKRIAEALGVLHAEPILVVLPDDPRLGEFRAEFGGVFGLIEERPTDGPDDEPGFAGSDKIVGSAELFEELDEDNDDLVNPRAYLTARLLDIYVGDWDRHVDQWRWARFKENGKNMWYPIPRDRDQAFAFFDGLFPSLAEKRWMVRQLENYKKDEPDVVSLTHSGRHLDRRILSRLSQDEWRAVTEEVESKLTDTVIDEAVNNLPPEIQEIESYELTHRLLDHREMLPALSDQFYKYLARYVDVRLSKKSEFVFVNRLDNGDVAVKVFKRDKETGEKKTDGVVYDRTFRRGETGEVRIYLMGGDDKVEVTGVASSSIVVRTLGGDGNDEFVDESRVSGYFLGLVPFIPDAENSTFFYDRKDSSSFVSGPSTKIIYKQIEPVQPPQFGPPPKFSSMKPPIERRDYGHDVRPVPFLGFTADEGFFFGGGPAITRYSFGKYPYAYKFSLLGNYAFRTGAFRIALAADIVDVFPGARLSIEGQISVPRSVGNFYGFGNETVRDKDLEADDFYKVKTDNYSLRPKLSFKMHENLDWYFGAGYSFTNLKRRDSPFVRLLADSLGLYGAGKFRQLYFSTGIEIDTRDRKIASTRGIYAAVDVAHTPDILDLTDRYTRLSGETRFYLSDTLLADFTLAFRIGGQKLYGKFPFFEAAFLGGKSSLRGFRNYRFAGNSAAYGNVDLRFYLKRIWIIFPADFGLFTFADAGRVWVDGESPGDWHTDTGAGIWFAPVRRDFTISIGAGFSNEATQIIAGLGFAY